MNIIDSRYRTSGKSFSGAVRLKHYVPSGKYKVAQFIGTNDLGNVPEDSSVIVTLATSEPWGGTTVDFPKGHYFSADITSALNAAIAPLVAPGAATISYVVTTNKFRIVTDTIFTLVPTGRMATILGFGTRTFEISTQEFTANLVPYPFFGMRLLNFKRPNGSVLVPTEDTITITSDANYGGIIRDVPSEILYLEMGTHEFSYTFQLPDGSPYVFESDWRLVLEKIKNT